MTNELEIARDKINNIDLKILNLIKERQEVVIDVAKYKIANNMPILQSDREREVINARCVIARSLGLDEGFVTDLFELIMETSKNKQKEIIENV